ncbi:hypothetical protein NEF87_000600 [Candidatus Lokiarchaeum ossiferum]|uniref:Zinc ribbon domain-containing protein n=1 Tax=Candidatus Lokiarchaeum ossiferum TaxID=2951803 RepID=A0ABY6HLQ4_9ARCH|nr:hypothetical protein NEF87_000600 [Candidatus Lokiarchaeum sp. B-35]
MSNRSQFCPECGRPLGINDVCENCGHNINLQVETQENLSSPAEKKENESITNQTHINPHRHLWNPIEKVVVILGTYGWIFSAAISLLFLILSFIGVIASFSANFLIDLLFSGFALFLSVQYGKKFAERVKARDWYYIVNNVWIIGSFRIPKMLVIGLILVPLLNWWGGWIILLPVIAITFIGPVPTQWSVTKKNN